LRWISDGCRVVVINVFARSGWTNRGWVREREYFRDMDAVTTLRRGEELAVAREVGHEVEFLDFFDEMSRSRRARLVGLIGHGIIPRRNSAILRDVDTSLSDRIEAADTVIFPLGLGEIPNPDHTLLAQLGIEFALRGYRVEFFEDLPYAATVESVIAPFYDQFVMTPIGTEIDLDRKMEIIELYESQLSPSWRDQIRAHALRIDPSQPHERRWQVSGVAAGVPSQ